VRFSRLLLVTLIPLLCIPALAQQTQQATAAPASDPQAVAVVQAAITALGGATAIGQPQSWTLQATLQGPFVNNTVNYTLGLDSPNTYTSTQSGSQRTVRRLMQSLFVPVLVGPVLFFESQTSQFIMRSVGATSINSTPVNVVSFSVKSAPSITSQTWWFDDKTGLPIRVDFQLPAEIGSRMSYEGVIDFFDYRVIGGIAYPFRIAMPLGARPPEIVTIQSVATSTTLSVSYHDASSGDF
jgi:hypothetical protein